MNYAATRDNYSSEGTTPVQFRVQPEIFARFPELQIIVAVVHGIDNTVERPAISARWHEVWKRAQRESVYGNAQSHPRVRSWREQFQSFGVSGKKHPSSIEAVLRRALKAGSEPFFINPLVDFYNTVSLKHVVPAGAFDLDQIENPLELRLTRAGDTFHALDADSPVAVEPDEMGYVAGSIVLTRHIMWRQSREGLITPETTSLILLSEGLRDFDTPDARIADVVQNEFTTGMREHFGAMARPFIVTSEQPEIEW
ncbi:B3/4 domain-containing protein [soil metagenome]